MARKPNKAAFWVVCGTILGLAVVLYVPVIRKIFHFDFLHFADIVICVFAGLLGIAVFEILKAVRK